MPVTNIAEQLMESKTNPEVDEYLYLDAKLLRGGDTAPKNRSPFQDAVIFVIGGGNYIEYQNLVDFIKVSGNKEFFYLLSFQYFNNSYFVAAKKYIKHN